MRQKKWIYLGWFAGAVVFSSCGGPVPIGGPGQSTTTPVTQTDVPVTQPANNPTVIPPAPPPSPTHPVTHRRGPSVSIVQANINGADSLYLLLSAPLNFRMSEGGTFPFKDGEVTLQPSLDGKQTEVELYYDLKSLKLARDGLAQLTYQKLPGGRTIPYFTGGQGLGYQIPLHGLNSVHFYFDPSKKIFAIFVATPMPFKDASAFFKIKNVGVLVVMGDGSKNAAALGGALLVLGVKDQDPALQPGTLN